MKYYRLVYDYDNAKTYVSCDIAELDSMSRYEVTEGKRLKDRWNKVELLYAPSKGKGLSDYINNTYDWLVVSSKFVKVVQQYIRNEVEFLDVDIKNIKTNEKTEGYKLVNVINVVDALDMENSVWSTYKTNSTEILNVKKYVLDSKKVESSNMFILSNDECPIWVSETVRQVIIENNLSGFDFWEVEMSR